LLIETPKKRNMDGTPTLLILADDLTGANDVGAQFAKRGIRSVVLVEPGVSGFPSGYQVVVVNTESRHVGASIAAERVRRIAELGLRAGAQYFFKKTDSTLRGNIGAELKALLEATAEAAIPFVPAFPEMGRTTRGGIHYVHAVPIAETEFARDPLSPVTASAVSEVLRRQTDLVATSVSLRTGEPEIPIGCAVFDCESRAEMGRIARWAAETNRLRVLAGSAAFAEELPAVLSLRQGREPRVNAGKPILLVNGSLNPRSLEQVSAATGFRRVRMDAEVLLGLKGERALFERLQSAKGEDVLLFSAEKPEEAAKLLAMAAGLGCESAEAHLKVARQTGGIVREAIRKNGFRTLVVFGGDTLIGIARACGWQAFVPKAEVAAGITVASPLETELTVISKAGGFGDRDVVQRIVDWVDDHSKDRAEL
jgi:D-threonate/D-erythronate kinase